MPKTTKGLSPLAVQRQKAAGLFADGDGLYLRVTDGGTKYWVFRFSLSGKRREMFIGKFPDMALAAARGEAVECRKQVKQGLDPIEARKSDRERAAAQKIIKDARAVTFEDCAEGYMEAHRDSWRNAKHKQQWENTLSHYVYPVFGKLPVGDIDHPLVLQVLKPIWKTRTETAKRLRGRIEAVLDWAHASDYRTGENPARWKGKLQTLLAAPSKIAKVIHHPSLPYSDIQAFLEAVKQEYGAGALALRFLILTASRTNEVLGARWSEIDEAKREWLIPADRMKGGRAHRIPLSNEAMAVIGEAKALSTGKGTVVFPSPRGDVPLSNMALAMLVRRMNAQEVKPRWVDGKTREPAVPHGFRSTFRDWCAEVTAFPREVAEACLAHISGDKVESAYLRTDFIEKRRQLMDKWAKHCTTPAVKAGNVVVSIRA